MPNPKLKFLDQCGEVMRFRQFSRRTEETYRHWIKRFILWSGKRHPRDMGELEVRAFLTHLAADRNVAASTQNQVKVVYDASADPELDYYELRGSAGPEFRSGDAVVVGTNLPEAPREFVTDFGLTQPGAKASFSVYVVLTTGNEKGSAPMTVERPAA